MRSFDPKDNTETKHETLRIESLAASWPLSDSPGAVGILVGGGIVAAVVGLGVALFALPA